MEPVELYILFENAPPPPYMPQYSLGITAAIENKHSLNESNHASIKDDNIRSSQN